MKILFLTNVPSPYRMDFFDELGTLSDLTVLFDRKSVSYREENWMKLKPNNFKAVFLKGIETKNIKISWEIFKYINNKSFDLIIVGGYSTLNGLLAIMYMKLKKIPFILNSDGGMVKNEKRINFLIKKYFISSASAWLSTGKITNKYLVHYGAKMDDIYIYPFTSIKENELMQKILSRKEKKQYKNSLGMKEEIIILSVGRFIPSKGYDLLLKAFPSVKGNTALYIVGGKATEEYINLKNELELDNVNFIDFLSKEDLAKYYMAADLFVLPTRSDIWGLVINEAMAKGLPIITTDKCVAGVEMISNSENGFLVKNNNIDSLSEKINIVLEKDYMQMGNKSLEIISNYTIESMAKIHIEIFEKILKGRKK